MRLALTVVAYGLACGPVCAFLALRTPLETLEALNREIHFIVPPLGVSRSSQLATRLTALSQSARKRKTACVCEPWPSFRTRSTRQQATSSRSQVLRAPTAAKIAKMYVKSHVKLSRCVAANTKDVRLVDGGVEAAITAAEASNVEHGELKRACSRLESAVRTVSITGPGLVLQAQA